MRKKLLRGFAAALSVLLAAWLGWVVLHAGLAPAFMLPSLLGLAALGTIRPLFAAYVNIALLPMLGSLVLVLELPYFVPAELFTYAAVCGWLLHIGVFGWNWRPMALHPWLIVWATLACVSIAVEMKVSVWGEAGGALLQRLPDLFTGYDRQSHLYPIRAGFTILGGVVSFVFISQCVRTARETSRMLRTLLWAGVGVSTYAVVQYITGMDLHMGLLVHSTLRDQASLGAYLVLVLGIALGYRAGSYSGNRVTAVLALMACAVGLLCSQSRTAWLAALILVAVLLYRWLGRVRDWSHVRRSATLLALASVALAIGVAVAQRLDTQGKYGSLMSPLWQGLNPDRPGSPSFNRLPFWRAALDGMSERPVWGIGVGRFTSTPYVLERRTKIANAHNDFLQIGSELGLAGLSVWLGILGSWFLALRERHRKMAPSDESWQLKALALGIGGYLLAGLAGHSLIYEEQQLIFMSALALGAREDAKSLSARQRWIVGGVCLLILASFVIRHPLPGLGT
jgi:O-antigen ligase